MKQFLFDEYHQGLKTIMILVLTQSSTGIILLFGVGSVGLTNVGNYCGSGNGNLSILLPSDAAEQEKQLVTVLSKSACVSSEISSWFAGTFENICQITQGVNAML